MSDIFDKPEIDGGDNASAIAVGKLKAFVERRERLEDEKSTICEDIKELNAEVKGEGFDIKAFNEVIKLRKLEKADRDAREAMRQLYGEALGIFG